MSSQTTVYLFNLVLYVSIAFALNQARAMYAGGKMGQVIHILLVFVVLLFCSDYVRVLEALMPENVAVTAQSLLHTAGLAVLAFGAIRLGTKS